MSVDRMPDDMAERTARLVNAVEDQLAAAQDDKKQVYADLREELKSLGMGGVEVSKEVAAFKAAIAETRKTSEQRLAAGEKADRADELVSIIRASHARARARKGEITEPQPSPMAGKAAASIPPEVAAGNSENIEITSVEGVNEPHMTVAIDANTGGDDVESGASARPAGQETGTQPSGFEDGVEIDLRSGPDPKRAPHSQSSDLHDGRLQAAPASALDESRDSAAGVEAPAAPVNPRCLKAQRGEFCKFADKAYSCSGCIQADLQAKARVA